MLRFKKSMFSINLIIFFLFSCSKQENVIGLYVSKNNLNTIDSVWVFANGTYLNQMNRKSDNSLIYKNLGKWEVKRGFITFFNFFSDEDEEHSKEFKNFEKVLITSKFEIEKRNGKIIIHHKDMHDNIYLEKVN